MGSAAVVVAIDAGGIDQRPSLEQAKTQRFSRETIQRHGRQREGRDGVQRLGPRAVPATIQLQRNGGQRRVTLLGNDLAAHGDVAKPWKNIEDGPVAQLLIGRRDQFLNLRLRCRNIPLPHRPGALGLKPQHEPVRHLRHVLAARGQQRKSRCFQWLDNAIPSPMLGPIERFLIFLNLLEELAARGSQAAVAVAVVGVNALQQVLEEQPFSLQVGSQRPAA